MTPRLPELTNREEQVLELLSQGVEVRAIARTFGTRPDTVAKQAESARVKLGGLNMKHAIAIYNRAVRTLEPVA